MNGAVRTQERLKEMLGSPIQNKPANIEAVIKSDITNVLRSYFILSDKSIEIKIEQQSNNFAINISAEATNIKAMNYLR